MRTSKPTRALTLALAAAAAATVALPAAADAAGVSVYPSPGARTAAPGTQIASVARGTVTEVGFDGAYGNKTVITLEDGTEIWYCHQSSTQVSVGQQVDPGDPIGQVGATGNVTGPHLHLEVRPGGGDPVDPYNVLVEHHVKP